jgi:hypothetical protein
MLVNNTRPRQDPDRDIRGAPIGSVSSHERLILHTVNTLLDDIGSIMIPVIIR